MNDPFLMKIEEYLDGTLSPDEAGQMEAHLADCGECRAEIETCRHILRLAQAAAPVPIPKDLGASIRRRVDGLERTPPAGRLLALRWVAAVVAAAVLLLVVFPSFQKQEPDPLPRMAVVPDEIGRSDTSLEDWFEQARNSMPGDAVLLAEEACESGLLEKVREELARTRGGARIRLLAMEDLFIQLLNDPSPEHLANEARLVAMAGG